MSDYSVTLAAGAEVWEYQGRLMYRYNARLKVAGDSVKLTYYDNGITCGYCKNQLTGAAREKAKAEYDDAAKEARFERTGRNARRRLYDTVAANLGKHRDHRGKRQSFKLLTLTFRADVKKLDEANKQFKRFVQRLNYHFDPEGGQWLRYVAVPELQMTNHRYVWHYHVLLFNCPFLPVSGEMVDRLIERGALPRDYDKRDTLYYLWGQGSVDVCAVSFSDAYDVAGYVSKYVGKGLEGVYEYARDEGILYCKRYLHSQGLLGPRVLIAFLPAETRQRIAAYFARHAKHCKRRGKIDTHYQEWSAVCDYVGQVSGIDLRAAKCHVAKLIGVFDRYSYGLA